MSNSKTKHHKPKPKPARTDAKPVAETRIDAPHELVVNPATREPAAVSAAVSAGAVSNEAPAEGDLPVEQLRAQASQLGEHLRDRQKDLDHREAQLNTRVAQLETDARNARLWLAERQAELDARHEELCRQQKETQRRHNRLAAAENVIRRRQKELDARETSLDKEAAAREESRESTRHSALQSREQALDRMAEGLHRRQRELDQAAVETEQLREKLIEDREEWDRRAREERQRLVARQRREAAELAEKRLALQRRSEQVDRTQGALEQLREELGRMHRSTLEIRLATEELWVQLAGTAPPAALTRSLGQIRSRLADDYRAAKAELVEQKRALAAMRLELCRQQESLVQQNDRIEQWAGKRECEIQQQAARLVAREQELDRQQFELQEQAEQWQVDRLGYQQEIRHLRRELQEATVPG